MRGGGPGPRRRGSYRRRYCRGARGGGCSGSSGLLLHQLQKERQRRRGGWRHRYSPGGFRSLLGVALRGLLLPRRGLLGLGLRAGGG